MKSADVVFFDVAGTLMGVRGSVGDIYARTALRHGVSVDARLLERDFVAAFRRQSSAPCASPEEADPAAAERGWWRELVAKVFAGRMAPGLFESFFHDVYEIFGTSEGWELFPDVLPVLDEFLCRGCRLGIISNFDSRLDDLLPAMGLGQYFESVVLSWREGSAKPDRRIFLRACERMNVAPGLAMHVGDSTTEDAGGALGAGLQAVLLDRRGRHSDWRRCRRISSLLELLEPTGTDTTLAVP